MNRYRQTPGTQADGLTHGFRVASQVRQRHSQQLAGAALQMAVQEAVEAAVVEALFSRATEEFVDGLLLAQRALAGGQREPRAPGKRR